MGVAYGAYHQSRLSKREVGIRAVEEQQKAIRDAKLAEEKKRSVAGNKTLDTVSNCDTLTHQCLVLQRRTEPSKSCLTERSKFRLVLDVSSGKIEVNRSEFDDKPPVVKFVVV